MKRALVLLFALVLSVCHGFSPIATTTRQSMRGSTVVMDGKTRVLRDRIKSVKNTRRITEAMRLVAAARVRKAQEAVLKSRPLISQLQLVIKTIRFIHLAASIFFMIGHHAKGSINMHFQLLKIMAGCFAPN